MAKAGIQPITTASLATPKITGISKPAKMKSTPKVKASAMSALFGQKKTKPTIQSVPTKVPSF